MGSLIVLLEGLAVHRTAIHLENEETVIRKRKWKSF